MILLPFAWQRVVADKAEIKRHWPAILLLGAIGVGSFNAFLYSGLQYTTATNAMLIQAMIPATVLGLSFLIFRTRPEAGQVPAVVIAAAGVVIIVFKADVMAMLSLRFGSGDALVLCGVLAWSLYTALLRIAPPIHPLSFLALTFLIGVAMMLPLAMFEWRLSTIKFTAEVAASFAYVAILPSLVAYLLFNIAVRQIGANKAGQMVSLQPLFGALLSVLLLDEQLHNYHFSGIALILLGIAYPMLKSR